MELLLPEAGLIIWLLFIVFILLLLPVLFALYSILKNEFKDSTTKLTWTLVVLLLPIFGPVLYYLIGKKQIVKNN